MICHIYERVLFSRLNADPEFSSVVCPTSNTCVERFLDLVISVNGMLTDELSHIVICDQNIDMPVRFLSFIIQIRRENTNQHLCLLNRTPLSLAQTLQVASRSGDSVGYF